LSQFFTLSLSCEPHRNTTDFEKTRIATDLMTECLGQLILNHEKVFYFEKGRYLDAEKRSDGSALGFKEVFLNTEYYLLSFPRGTPVSSLSEHYYLFTDHDLFQDLRGIVTHTSIVFSECDQVRKDSSQLEQVVSRLKDVKLLDRLDKKQGWTYVGEKQKTFKVHNDSIDVHVFWCDTLKKVLLLGRK
jgi:hypothetical protein